MVDADPGITLCGSISGGLQGVTRIFVTTVLLKLVGM